MPIVLAGQKALADDINDALASCIGGEARGGSTATITTTETVWATTGSLDLAADSTYEIMLVASYFGSVANDEFDFRIRDTNVSGSNRREVITPKFPSAGIPYIIYASFLWTTTSALTATWVATVQRLSGSGNITIQGGSYLKATYLAPSGHIATI